MRKLQGSKGAKRVKRIKNTLNEFRPQLTPQFARSIGRVFSSAGKQANAIRGSRGDTIIEILVSTAILAIVFGTAFASSGRSLQEGTDASNRNHALAIAEQQIALIKNSASSSNGPAKYPANQPFCLKDDGSMDTTDIDPTTKACSFAANAPFSVADSFNGSTLTFTVMVKWSGVNGIDNNVTLYYHSDNVAAQS